MKILILDGINKNTLAIIRHLGKLKLGQLDVISHTSYAICFYSRFVHNKILSPNPAKDKDQYIHFLLDLLKKKKYDLLIPVSHRSYQICAEVQKKIKENTNIFITSSQNINTALSKWETFLLARKLKIPCPNTYKMLDFSDIKKVRLDYPIVIKAPFEMGINVIEYAYDFQELEKKYSIICSKYKFEYPNLPLLQEYIKGRGYGFFAFYENGQCKHYFMHKRIREYPVNGGASVCAESYSDNNLLQYGKKILDHLEWDGVAMAEFKKDENDGKYKLMEINPKFWGSLDLAIVSGVNFPMMLVRRAMNETIQQSSKYRKLHFQWLLNGELFHLIEKPRSFFPVLIDLFKSKNDIWISDPFPNVFQIVKVVEYFYKRLFK